MNSSQHLDALGIVRWQRRNLPVAIDQIMIISDAPLTPREDQFLTSMLKAIGVERSDVHISDNPQNIEQEIHSIKPALILSFSNMPPLVKSEIPVINTYHPAHLLRNPQDKRKAYQDLKYALNRKIAICQSNQMNQNN